MAKEKKTSLSDAVKSLEKEYGEGLVLQGADSIPVRGVIPFSYPSLNMITGIGGIARGRIIEIHGLDGTFKTSFLLDLIAQEQKLGGKCVFIDAEYSYDPEYAIRLGVNVEELIVIQPSTAEEAFTATERLVDTGEVSLIGVDSIAALSPNAEAQNDFGASNMGVFARLFGQFFRKMTSKLGKSGCTLVFLNQLRDGLGGYVVQKVTPGGNALRFYASMRFEISKSNIKEGTDVKGVTLKVKTVKNKLGIPFQTTELEAIYEQGIDHIKDLIAVACYKGIIQKQGAGWMTYGDVKIQGVDNFKQLLSDNPELYEEIKNKL